MERRAVVKGETPPLRIIVGAFSNAMSLSVALKRPVRTFGAIAASRFSSFTVGSARVSLSVVCTLEWPSQRETFRRSLVAWRIVIAQVCRRTCGDSRFDESEAQRLSAVLPEDVFKPGTSHTAVAGIEK